MRSIGFLHTSPVHVATFDALLAASGADVRAVHVVDESVLADARVAGIESVRERLEARLAEVVDGGVDIVCCTCSTLGGLAEQIGAARDEEPRAPGATSLVRDAPIVRVDRPMARRAVELGERVTVVAALASTLEPSRDVLLDEATRAERVVQVETHVGEDAWEAFIAGDFDGYERQIVEACRHAARDADVIVLAQASMVGVIERLEHLAVPVLASPALAVEFLLGEVS